jgi:signal transduction histidine kinase
MDGTARGPLNAAFLAKAIVGVVGGGFCLVALVSVVGPGPVPRTPLDLAFAGVATMVAVLEVYGLTRLAGLITELREARTELTHAVVAGERLRFARQLHDLLGLSLAAILPKGELAYHILPSNPARARLELTEILGIARRALADFRAVADGYRDQDLDVPRGAEPVEADQRVPWRMTLLGVAVLCGIFAQGVLYRAREVGGIPAFAVVVGALLLLLVVQLWYLMRPAAARLRPAIGAGMLVAQAILVFAPAIGLGVPLVGAGFLAGTLLLMLPVVAGASAFALVVVIAGVRAEATGLVRDVAQTTAGVLFTGLVVFALTWMFRLARELRTDRRKLARVAVARERQRFARDLHDLLGLSLSAITLKSELTYRLVDRCPARARAELNEILDMSRLAMADVRLVASGYRELSLRQEFRTAESLLAAADLDVRLEVHCGDLPGEVGTLLATVLREGVTNVLRHSKGERCEITVRRRDGMVCLEIINDGVAKRPLGGPAGRGIDNLSYRVAQLGGKVFAGLEADGRYRLRAMVPALEPAGVLGDPDGVHPVARVELADDRGQIVPHGPRG